MVKLCSLASLSPSPPLVWCVVVVVSGLDKDKIVWQSSDLGLSEAVIRTLMMETGLGVAAITSLISTISTSAANRLIGEVVQSRRRPLLGPSPG